MKTQPNTVTAHIPRENLPAIEKALLDQASVEALRAENAALLKAIASRDKLLAQITLKEFSIEIEPTAAEKG